MLILTLTAELVGITDLVPKDTEDAPFFYTFRVQCTSCRETHPNWVSFNRFEANEQSGSRGEANFVWRCKSCKREHTASIKAAPLPYPQTSPPKRQKILEIDCRGLELVDFKPEGEWQATSSETTTKFPTIDLDEGDWFDYDEKAGEEVSVKDCVWEIRRNA